MRDKNPKYSEHGQMEMKSFSKHRNNESGAKRLDGVSTQPTDDSAISSVTDEEILCDMSDMFAGADLDIWCQL